MDKKQVRKCYKLDMQHFLRSYYGIDNEQLILDLSNLSHKDLKYVASAYGFDLMRINFECVSLEQLANGEIIIVKDAFGKSAPYVNPNRNLLNDEDIGYGNEIRRQKKLRTDD